MKVFQTTYNPTTVDLTKPTSTVTPTISQATTTLLGTTPTTTAIQHTTPALLQAVLQRQELLVGHLQLQQTHPLYQLLLHQCHHHHHHHPTTTSQPPTSGSGTSGVSSGSVSISGGSHY
jgi:hypothetical protein